MKTLTADFVGPRLAVIVALIWLSGITLGFPVALRIFTAFSYLTVALGLFFPALGTLGLGMVASADNIARASILTGGLFRYHTVNYWLLIVSFLFLPVLIRRRDPHTKLLYVYLLVLSLGLALTPNLREGVSTIFHITGFFGMLIYFLRAGSDRGLWAWLGLLCGITGALAGFVYFYQYGLLIEALTDYNGWAMLPLTALFTTCLAFSSGAVSRAQERVLIVLLFMNWVFIFLTGSRGGLLTSGAVFIFLLGHMRGTRTRMFCGIAGLLVITVWVSVFGDLAERSLARSEKLLMAQDSDALVRASTGRSAVAWGGVHLFLENPVGVGTGGFRSSLWTADVYVPVRYRHMEAHSAWIKTLAENGVVGLLFLGAFVFSYTYVGWRRRSRRLFVLGMFVTLAFSLRFVTAEFESKGLWLLGAGAAVLLNSKPDRGTWRKKRKRACSI